MLRVQADACLLNQDKTGENEEVCERENGWLFETRLSMHCIYDICICRMGFLFLDSLIYFILFFPSRGTGVLNGEIYRIHLFCQVWGVI